MSRIRVTATALALIALISLIWALAGSPGSAATASSSAKSAKTAKAGAPRKAGANANQIGRGRHLAIVSGCGDCHTPGTLFGAPDFSRTLSGSELGWQGPWGTTYARNLTPDPNTGLGYYSEKEFVAAMKSGKRLDGSPMLPPMPWQDYTQFSDDDLFAIAAYLKSLPPIDHAVPDRLPAGTQAQGAVLTFPPPPAWDAPREKK